jgi:hypothetical protein
MKHARRPPAASVALALIACGGSAQEAPPRTPERSFRHAPVRVAVPAEGAVLPSRFVGSLPFVEASVDGLEGLWFLLDTGYDANVLDARIAARLRERVVEIEEGATVTAASGATRELGQAAALRHVRLGALDLHGVDAVVDDLAPISTSVEVELAGILGSNNFGSLALTIDFPAQRVSVALERLAATDAGVVPLVRGQTLPEIELPVCGHPARLLIDTGSNEYLAVTRALAAEAPWAFGPRPFARATTAAGESARLEFGRLGCDVALGPHTLARPIAAVSLAGGRIGCQLLQAFRLTLDARESLARFERTVLTPLQSPPWRGHGAGWRVVEGRTLVLDIVPGSPAETAGLEVGDEILFHGPGPLDATGPCGELHWLPSSFDGELACVRRGGESLHFELANVELLP